jgi:hypothetical protein
MYTAVSDVCVFYINIILCAMYSWNVSGQYCFIAASHVPCFLTFWHSVNFSPFILQVITRQQKTVFETGVLFGSDCSHFLKYEFCNENLEILCSHLQLTLEDDATLLFRNVRHLSPDDAVPSQKNRKIDVQMFSVCVGAHVQFVTVILSLLLEIGHVNKGALYVALHCHCCSVVEPVSQCKWTNCVAVSAEWSVQESYRNIKKSITN